ncbi:MAG: hypothetical protein KTR24_17075 [Saprospiraceae bacterium]|nr:hypothetical protein [Saprospiraceae bacterium]
MAFFSFFKAPRHQQFKYVPRFYDPQKERLDEILGRADGEELSPTDLAKSRIARSFRSRSSNGDIAKRSRRRSNFLLLAIIAVLLVLTYVLLTVYLPRFIHLIEG